VSVKKYRKKPVVVEAMAYDGTNQCCYTLMAWMDECCSTSTCVDCIRTVAFIIPTLEGDMRADPGDYIVKEPFPTGDRKFYPCKPDIFAATYEEVTE
jgi:hypothetical protein